MSVNITKDKAIKIDVWACIALAGVILTTALEGSGMSAHDLTSWSIVFKTIGNVVGNPVKVVTIALAVLAFFRPRPHTQVDNTKGSR